MLELLPIRIRCLIVLCALLGAAFAAAPASADSLRPISLTMSTDEAEGWADKTLLFDVEAKNTGLLSRTFDLRVLDLPAGWEFDFTPPSLTLESGASRHSTLSLFLPSEAPDAGNVTMRIVAIQEDRSLSEPTAFHVFLTAPPAAAPEDEDDHLQVEMTTTRSSAAPGERVEGLLLMRNDGPTHIEVNLDIDAPSPWNVRFKDGNFYIIQQGIARQFVIEATVPMNTPEGTVQNVLVTARIGEYEMQSIWSITALAASASDEDDASTTTAETYEPEGEADEPEGDTVTVTDSETPAPVVPKPIILSAVELSPGASGTGALVLENPTTDDLTFVLAGRAADGWPMRFELTEITLAPGTTRTLWFTVDAPDDVVPGGAGTGTITATTSSGSVLESPFALHVIEGSNSATALRDPVPTSTQGEATLPVTPTTIGLAIGLGAVGAGALSLAHRPWREKFLWGAAGLYTRLLKPDVLGHDEREKLHTTISQQPGIHFHALQRELGWNTGTLTYHVRVLERHQFVVSRRDGMLRRFYLVGQAPRKEEFGGPTGLRADVLEAVRGQPGISQSDLTFALGANKQTVNYHVKALERTGTLRIEKRGRDTFLFLSEDDVTIASQKVPA